MGLRRLKARVSGLEAHAHQTMSAADAVIKLAGDLIEDLKDGVTVWIGIGSIGKLITIKLDPREADEK